MTNDKSAEEIVRGRIEAIKARCEAATPGPWYNFGDWAVHTESDVEHNGIAHEKIIGTVKAASATFIAHAREDIPYLLERIAELEAENKSLAINGGKYMQIAETRYEMYEEAIKRAEAAEIKLAASKQETRAAVEDMLQDRHCTLCRHHLSEGGDCYGVSKCAVNGIRVGWEWRGTQEAGEESG